MHNTHSSVNEICSIQHCDALHFGFVHSRSLVWWGRSVVRDELITGPYTGPSLNTYTIQYNIMQHNPSIQYNTIQYNAIRYNAMQSINTIQYNTIQSICTGPARNHPSIQTTSHPDLINTSLRKYFKMRRNDPHLISIIFHHYLLWYP